ncbi:hypothetical protein E8D34_12910 [Nocardioides sp. GY 10113]|uniref:hypothetical protein n=1 Tax=Nocardioides sp. GY 10113 TaxID=2569761 RepID=UPI0010A924FF|nr:hypothetical protein [Nocardioides sp. GY 10113]TIC84983.1 hypothetical protein E8D34_12910 [Nocardioides sp. GY 10113]
MRTALISLLLVVATLLAPLGIVGTWLHARVDDTDAYVATVAPLADEPALREELGRVVGDAALEDLDERLPFALPAMAEEWVRASADAVVANTGFPDFWREANRTVHEEFLRLVRDGVDDDEDDWVAVDVGPLLVSTLERLDRYGLAVSADDVALRVPMVRESTLLEQRDAYLALRRTSYAAWAVWVLLVVLAVALGRGWRGRLRALGVGALGLALAAVLVILATWPAAEVAGRIAEEDRSELARLTTEVVVRSLAPYASWFLLAAPVGLALVALSFLPRRGSGPGPAGRTSSRLAT